MSQEQTENKDPTLADAEPASIPGPPPSRTRRHFWLILAGTCLVGLACRLMILHEYLTENPMAQDPTLDAGTYWEWAQQIADGDLIQDVPFFSAPLYPYLLGLIRAFGGTLTTVYVLQLLANLITACVLARTARDRFSPGTGLLTAALFLALLEPASFSLRILACSLHLLLVSIVWALLVGAQTRPSIRQHMLLGAVLGLLCLAYPPVGILVVVVGPWLFWQSRRRFVNAMRAAVPVGIAAIVIAPATVHNWHATGGDLFFVQALSGVTLGLGNSPGATGLYHPIPGISLTREHMLHDAARVYQAETGNPPSWAKTNAYFRDQTFREWRSKPTWAIELAARKCYWFLTGRNWSDNCQPTDEIACGLATWLGRLAPIPTPWIVGLGLVGLAMMLRHPIRHAPEWLLVAIPLLVVTMFWYSPRFRLPAVPILTVTAAWTVVRAIHARRNLPVLIAGILALSVSIGLGLLNQHLKFDRRVRWMVAMRLADKGDFARAETELRQFLGEKPYSPTAVAALAYVKHKEGDKEKARELYQRAIELDPVNPNLPVLYGVLLAEIRQWDKAVDVLVGAIQARPELQTARRSLGLVLANVRKKGQPHDAIQTYARVCATDVATSEMRTEYGALLVDAQRWQDAVEQLSLALATNPNNAVAHYNLGVALGSLGRLDAAHTHLQRAVELAPNSPDMWHGMGILYARQKDYAKAAECFERALSLDPNAEKSRAALRRVRELAGQP